MFVKLKSFDFDTNRIFTNFFTLYIFVFTAQSDNGLVLAYYKTKDSPKAKGYLRIKPHGKVVEYMHIYMVETNQK